jgi:hypothetical protein
MVDAADSIIGSSYWKRYESKIVNSVNGLVNADPTPSQAEVSRMKPGRCRDLTLST